MRITTELLCCLVQRFERLAFYIQENKMRASSPARLHLPSCNKELRRSPVGVSTPVRIPRPSRARAPVGITRTSASVGIAITCGAGAHVGVSSAGTSTHVSIARTRTCAGTHVGVARTGARAHVRVTHARTRVHVRVAHAGCARATTCRTAGRARTGCAGRPRGVRVVRVTCSVRIASSRAAAPDNGYREQGQQS